MISNGRINPHPCAIWQEETGRFVTTVVVTVAVTVAVYSVVKQHKAVSKVKNIMLRQIVIRTGHGTSIRIVIMPNTRENNTHVMTADHNHGCTPGTMI